MSKLIDQPKTNIEFPPLPEEPATSEVGVTQLLSDTEQPQQEPTQQEEAQAAPEEIVEQKTQSGKKTPQESFRELKEKAIRMERERNEFAQRLSDYEQSKQVAPEPEEDLNVTIGSDDFVEGKHLSKVDRKIQKLEQTIKSYQEKTQQIAIEAQLKAQFPDFDKIVTKDNIERLRELAPHALNSINSNPDLYSKAIDAYEQIKLRGIVVEDTFAKDREIAQKNALKPRPLTSMAAQQGDSPLSKANAFANGLTPELQTQLLKEMSEARKNR